MKNSILFLCLCLSPLLAIGRQINQDTREVKYQYAEAIYEGRQLVGLKKMLNKSIYNDCCRTKFSNSGVIMDVEYKQEDILSFTLRFPSGQRKNVDISSSHFSNADKGWLYMLIKEKHRVKVKGCLCGNGGYWHADEIALVKQ